MNWIGVDPGISGAITIIRENGGVSSHKLDATPADIHYILNCSGLYHAYVMIEKVGPARGRDGRKQGVSSAFKFGMAYGIVQGVLACTKYQIEEVSPQKWQREFGCVISGGMEHGEKKKLTYKVAQQLFPAEKVAHWKADSMLIAEFCRRTYRQRNGV